MAVTFPSKMNMPVVTYTSVGGYTVTFQTPSNIGAVGVAIQNYDIMFMRSDGSFA